ncbi:hypothetical protein [Pseudomonas fluorescens]|uniref:NlpC/P60 domain-containing protein n=1 Tax=Pseudomonas fluorescens TaxID=294 RepID=A0A5E7EB08_PSEFL|nr:hypothetical protein [Pseudomonas fluorescens]VVO23976.1 hypothetical protein PS710_04470 [Pseudomonas fluorescens]
MINKFLSAPYRDGGRGPAAYDCWGLCIAVRHQLLGLPLLPSLGAVGKDKVRENTRAYRKLRQGMDVCAPEIGAIAAVFRGTACLHVGVVIEADGRLKVLDTNPGGARLRTVREFETDFPKVVFYRDRIFPV